jgi:hypothetical protein
VNVVPPDELEVLRELVGQSRSRPWRFLPSRLDDAVVSTVLDDLAGALDDPANVVVAAGGNAPIAAAALTVLPWDSEVLGSRMTALRCFVAGAPNAADALAGVVADALARAAAAGVSGVIGRASTDDVAALHALERNGFLLMDSQLDYVFDYERTPFDAASRPEPADDVVVRLASANDVAGLMDVAGQAFNGHFGRFHADERIGRERATEVYRQWIKSSIEDYADWVVVAEVDGALAGYTVWRKPSPLEAKHGIRLGHYSIGAVAPTAPRRGLFTLVTYEGLRHVEGVADWVEGPTHVNNYGVQRGYARLGLKVEGARHTFHRWLD